MARDYDEMEYDNPIDEDFEGNTDECLWCGEFVDRGVKFCNEDCERSYKRKIENEKLK